MPKKCVSRSQRSSRVRCHMRLHDRDERPQPERQRHEEEVVDRRRRELDPREVDRRDGECSVHVRCPVLVTAILSVARPGRPHRPEGMIHHWASRPEDTADGTRARGARQPRRRAGRWRARSSPRWSSPCSCRTTSGWARMGVARRSKAVLLVAVIAADPRSVTRRSRELRVLSIALVSVLVIGSLWSTVLLIDALIHGGPETNSAARSARGRLDRLGVEQHRVRTALLGARRRRRGRSAPTTCLCIPTSRSRSS